MVPTVRVRRRVPSETQKTWGVMGGASASPAQDASAERVVVAPAGWWGVGRTPSADWRARVRPAAEPGENSVSLRRPSFGQRFGDTSRQTLTKPSSPAAQRATHRRLHTRTLTVHLLVRELVDAPAKLLQLVAPLGIASPLRWRAVAFAAGHLDHEGVLLEAEVDAGDRAAVSTMDQLRHRSWQPGATHQLEEPALQHRVAASVHEKPIESSCSPAARPTQELQPVGDHHRRAAAGADRTVDGGFQPAIADPCPCQIDDRAGRRCARPPVDSDSIDGWKLRGRVHDQRCAHASTDALHRVLDGIRLAAVETVEPCGRLVAEHRSDAEAEQTDLLPTLQAVRRADHSVDTGRQPAKNLLAGEGSQLGPGDAERDQLTE